MQSNRVAPIWQRVVCGGICVGGILALPLNAIHGEYHGRYGVALIIFGVVGLYLFGCVALRGKLPGKLPGTEYVRFRHSATHRDT